MPKTKKKKKKNKVDITFAAPSDQGPPLFRGFKSLNLIYDNIIDNHFDYCRIPFQAVQKVIINSSGYKLKLL